MKEIDFTRGCWGHAIHGSTFSGEEAPGLIAWVKDRLAGAQRVSFLCHSSQHISVGDIVKWSAGGGYTVAAPVYAVQQKRDPKDMYEVSVRITPDCRED